VIGHSVQGREIVALKVTRDANRLADGSRPTAMYASLQHAREWISPEVTRRLLHWFVDGYGKNAQATRLVDTRELWFLPVANPDGYQYTFDTERLWRKNLRDNNGDGAVTNVDGVDPNRNFAEHWNYDDAGSSSQTTSETYRGPSAASEPETKAYQGAPRPDQAEVPDQLPLVRAAHPLHVRLAGADADRGRPDLPRAVRDGQEPGDLRVRPGRRG
jgi:murein tripeptide amidase MpaA